MRKFLKYKDSPIKIWPNSAMSCPRITGRIEVDEGFLDGAGASITDITGQKRADEKIRTLNADLACRVAELEAANRELESFSYTVSHDLRAPLTNIGLSCQMMMELLVDRDDERCRNFVDGIFLATKQMDQLITLLLDFSRISRSSLNRETVSLSGMARVIAAEIQHTQPERRVTFHIEEGRTAHGDARLLRLVMLNLLGNAWKYTGKTETGVIEFGMTGLGEERRYFVRDNGAGFDMGQADKLFGAFQRLHKRNEFEGHGIGLATVQRIIQRHGGRVWAEGEVGKGATFYFTINNSFPIKKLSSDFDL